MTKFEIGDVVRLVDNALALGSVDHNEFFGQNLTVTRLDIGNEYEIVVTPLGGGNTEYFKESQLKLRLRTFETLEKGDILIFNHGRDEYIFQGYVGDIMFYMSDSGNIYYKSIKKMNHDNKIDANKVAIKQEEEAVVIKELTLVEVAKLAGIPVEQLRIKE